MQQAVLPPADIDATVDVLSRIYAPYEGERFEFAVAGIAEGAEPPTLWVRFPVTTDGFYAAAEQLAEWAAAGRNVYHGVNALTPGGFGAPSNRDFAAAAYVYLDADDDGAAQRVGDSLPPADFAVTTGTTPHLRQQFYFRLETLQRDPAAFDAVLKATAAATDCDRGAASLHRVLRTPGFRTVPPAHKRAKGYISELTSMAWLPGAVLDDPKPLAWWAEQFPPSAAVEPPRVASAPAVGAFDVDPLATLPAELADKIRRPAPLGERSEHFHHVVGWLGDFGHGIDAIVAILERHPNGVAEKYVDRLRPEVARCFGKRTPPTSAGRAAAAGDAETAAESLFKSFTAASLQTTKLDPLRWIVEDLMPHGAHILAGKPKTGKSFLMLQLGWAVATGTEFLGFVTSSADVLYIANEDGPRRLQDRCRKMFPDAVAWPERLTLATDCKPLDATRFDAFAKLIQERRPGLVIVDTWRTVRAEKKTVGTSYDQDYADLRPFAKLSEETGATILLIHHERKGAGRDDEVDPFEGISGSAAIFGALDGGFLLRRDDQGFTLTSKGRDLPETELALEQDEQTLLWRSLGDASEVRLSETRQTILELFRATTAGAPLTVADVAEQIDAEIKRETLARTLSRMAKDGQLLRTGRGEYRLATAAE